MSCVIEQSIKVVTSECFGEMVPKAFFWAGKWHKVVRVLEEWRDTGEWWKGEGEKKFYRVETHWGLFEILYDTATSSWRLYRAYD